MSHLLVVPNKSIFCILSLDPPLNDGTMSDSPCKLYIIKYELFIKDFYFDNRIFLTVHSFTTKATCKFTPQENLKGIIRIIHLEKWQYLPYYWSDIGFNFQGYCCELCIPSLNEESLEMLLERMKMIDLLVSSTGPTFSH